MTVPASPRSPAVSYFSTPPSPLDSHHPQEPTAPEMRDCFAGHCWKPFFLQVSSVSLVCCKTCICRWGCESLLESVLIILSV